MELGVNLQPDDDSIQRGAEGESNFEKACQNNNYTATKSTKKQDMYDHIDYWVKNKKGKTMAFDVKGRKKTSRSCKGYSNDWVWIEFKNVQGKEGWIKGKADFIAFELENSFLIVKRAELRELCKKLIKDTKTRVTSAKDARYLLYSRKDRKDILTQIKLSDIKDGLKTWEWCK